jgi:hypothetical protein
MPQGITVSAEQRYIQESQQVSGSQSLLDALAIAIEVFMAFCKVADEHQNLIKQFWVAFQERGNDPFLAESRAHDGLALALEEFLGRYPDKSYLEFFFDEPAIDVSIPQVEMEFKNALEKIALHNPYVLRTVKKVQKKVQWPLHDILKALFANYIHNKNAFPY